MTKSKKLLRAIDLYSGVGGWSLGLQLAGIEVVASYERWGVANETNFKNNKHQAQTVDIRRLALSDLPKSIDIVVGSPPCTQFSYSNRGGSGDIVDGLQDVIKFLTIVEYLKPRLWAMENVPRVAGIIEKELKHGGCLARFRHLGVTTQIVNMEEFGLPQRRRRCIAGNFDFDLLNTYKAVTARPTLGAIVKALSENKVSDPIYGITISKDDLFDHDVEDVLSIEEARINRASKCMHPVYNSMRFPDSFERSVRTITATCTRVSRESIVIESSETAESFRRLTIRERASLQGFPISFQFYGATYAQKLRMVGNAVPPSFAYYVAQAFKGISAEKINSLTNASSNLESPSPLPVRTKPDKAGSRFPIDRRFRFAIPSLRLKSGVRFELTNALLNDFPKWGVSFYFGNSKSIHSINLTSSLITRIIKGLPRKVALEVRESLDCCSEYIRKADISRMQNVWSHNGLGTTTPFMLLDELDALGNSTTTALLQHSEITQKLLSAVVSEQFGKSSIKLPGLMKLSRNSPLIIAGLLVGSVANAELSKKTHATSGRNQPSKRVI